MDGRHWRWPPPQQPSQPSSSQPQNPNFPFQNVYSQTPAFTQPQNPFPYHLWQQTPNFPPNFPSQNSNVYPPNPNLNFSYKQISAPAAHSQARAEKVDGAVSKARADLIAAGESVSSWKVAQAALVALQVDSWGSLGFSMQQVPSLHSLMITEGKIDAFIHCFVGVRRITSVYELGVEICKDEGIGQFEELGLGPLARHPLVLHYFSVNVDTTDILKITTEEIILLLSQFRNLCSSKDVKLEEFLDFVAEKRSVAGKEKLGIRILNFGYVTHFCSILFSP